MQKKNKYKITIEDIDTNDQVMIQLSTEDNVINIITDICNNINKKESFTFNQIKDKEWNIS